jgi:hypothetical protein
MSTPSSEFPGFAVTSGRSSPLQSRDSARAEAGVTIPRRGALILAALIMVIAVFYLLTIRRGNFWGDDYALYVHHAENVAEGRSYTDTGYVYNPDVPEYGPRAFPPVFPVLLSPIYALFGLNFHAMKIEIVVFFALTLAVVAAYWKRDLDWPYLMVLVAFLGFSPTFWAFKDEVLADLPFLFFFYATALLARSAPREGPAWWKWAVATGVLLYLTVGTRTVGVTLLGGLMLYDWLKYRRITRFAIFAVVVCIVLFLAQRQVFGHGEQSYADQLHPTLTSFIANLKEYPRYFVLLWTRSLGKRFSLVLFGITTVFACLGARLHFRKPIAPLEVFLLPYILALLVFPFTQLRYLFPLIPFYLYLMLLGLKTLPSMVRPVYAKAIFASVVVMIGVSYIAAFRQVTYGVIRQTDGRPSFNELCTFIQSHTDPTDVFVFRRSRALSLFTSRPASVYDYKHGDRLADYIAKIHAAYIVSSPIFEEDRETLIPFIRAHSSSLSEVYENADFQLYRINSYSGSTGPGAADGHPSANAAR